MHVLAGQRRTPEMVAAHDDDDVKTAVSRVLEHPTADFVNLAALAIIYNASYDPGIVDFHLTAYRGQIVPADVRTAALELMEAATRIARKSDLDHRGRCRGALVEAIVAGLLRARCAQVHEEHCLAGLGSAGGRSHPIDVIGISRGVEVYECKSQPLDLDADDVVLFESIAEASERARVELTLAFATLRTRAELDAAVCDMTSAAVIHGVSREDVLRLIDSTPDSPLPFGSC